MTKAERLHRLKKLKKKILAGPPPTQGMVRIGGGGQPLQFAIMSDDVITLLDILIEEENDSDQSAHC